MPHAHPDTHKRAQRGTLPSRVGARVAAFLILGILLCTTGPSHADALKRHHVELDAPADRSARLTVLISACADAVNELVGIAKSPDVTLRVSLDKAPSDPSHPLSVNLTEDESPVSAIHALTRALLVRHVLCRSGGDAKRAPRDLNWLAAAAAHAVLCGTQPGMLSTNSDFASVHPAYEKGTFPNLARLVQTPVPPQYGLAYRLYAVHCHVLQTALRSTLPHGSAVLGPLLDMHAKQCSAAESIAVVLDPYLRPAETVQAWYEHAALGISRRSGGTATVERVQERLKELESVPMVVPGGGAFGCVLVPIDEVPRHMEKYRPDADALGATRVAMYDLMKEAPGFLAPPLLEYIEAIDELGRGKSSAFKRTIRRARKNFAEAVDKQRALDAYLETFSQERERPEQQFELYFEAFRQSQARQYALDPRFHDYLDSLTP